MDLKDKLRAINGSNVLDACARKVLERAHCDKFSEIRRLVESGRLVVDVRIATEDDHDRWSVGLYPHTFEPRKR